MASVTLKKLSPSEASTMLNGSGNGASSEAGKRERSTLQSNSDEMSEVPITNDSPVSGRHEPGDESVAEPRDAELESVKVSEAIPLDARLGVSEAYEGDAADDSLPLDNGVWETINFESPVELVYTFDRSLNSGKEALYAWQLEELELLASAKPTDVAPHREALCAANGSGKDKYVISPFVVWFALTKVRSLCVITSSSGVQLTAQTENYISSLCREVNTKFGRPIFKITKRFIKCLKSGSEIRMFATDEAGKAEGYHPLESGAEMCIIVNEAKSVTPEIFSALERCTGFNYWLNVSTPGEPFGDFYDSFTNWRVTRRVTAFDCLHLARTDAIAETKRKYGETSSIYRSKVLALFTSIGGQVVINQDFLNTCIQFSVAKLIKPITFGRKRIGVDLAAGRDECAFVCSHGNRVVETEYFVEKDTTMTEERLEKFLVKHGGALGETCDIFADDGGVGHAIIDRLVRKGYNITRVLNQSRALDHSQFGNRGAEMWFNFARLIEEKLIILDLNCIGNKDDDKLYKQLAYRHYKKNETSGKITLKSKVEERADGHASPDRGDAYVLSFCGTDIDEITKAFKDAKKDAQPLGMTLAELMAQRNGRHREMIMGTGEKAKEAVTNNSIETLMSIKNN